MIDKVTIMSMNCRGLSDLKKRRDVMQFIRSKRINIVFLQDTHLTTQTIPYFDTLWNGMSYHSCHSSRSRGTSILINNNLSYTLIEEMKSECGNFQILACKIQNDSYLLVNVYGPNEDNPAFYNNLSNIIGQFDVDHMIVAGDFNFVMKPEADSLNYSGEYNVRAKRTFLELSYRYNLVDAWRHIYPNERKYTWSRRNPFKAGRLDMYFVSDELLNSIIETDIIPGYRTDHNIITLSIQNKQPKGNGLWKFNTSHLSDDEYIKIVKTCIIDTLKQYAVPLYDDGLYNDHKYYEFLQLTISDSLFYETLIMMIRGVTVKYSKQKAKRMRAYETSLIANIARAEEKLMKSGQQRDADMLDNLKNELEELRSPMIDGLIIRSRVAWHEKGERNTRYFLSLEKRNSCKKSIPYIKDGNITLLNNTEILEHLSNIYQNKYSKNITITPDPLFIAENVKNKLNTEDKLELDADINMLELTNALNNMKKGKTPGSNGFPVEFFRCFWLEIGPFLFRAVKTSLKKGEALPSHREGIITLIPKKGKSPHTNKRWRPITLLNADFKIVSTAVSNRLKRVMSKLISPVQTAYSAGRYIGENTRLLHDVIYWTRNNKKPGIILAADFEAAFESVAWNYLKLVLNEFNFGENLKAMISCLYLNTGNYSRILLNGHLGTKIQLQRGIRQGDPASGYLFNLAVSVLTEQISKSTKLTGIHIDRNNEIRISQYADDTILFLDGTKRSIEGSIEELNKFGLQSGLKINIEKTSCMAIGIFRKDQIRTKYDIDFVEQLTVLGIQVDRDLTNVADNNIQFKMPALKNELAQWRRRCLTPIGRINIVKALLLSKLVHIFVTLPNPSERCIKELERLLFGFVWGNKNDKIKRTKLVQQYSKDGLNMIQIDSFIKSLKLSWLKRLNNPEADWGILAANELPELWQLLTYGGKKLTSLRDKSNNPFYVDLLSALIQFNRNYCPSEKEIVTDSIWYSDLTKYKMGIVKEWDDKGIRFIGDLYNPNTGKIYSKQDLEIVYGIQLTFLCYTSLIRSLPHETRGKVSASIEKPNIPYKLQLVFSHNKFAKRAYNLFVENTNNNNCVSNERLQAKWIKDISNFTEGTLENVNKATLSTYLVYLHFRIINRIYATNKYLFNIKRIQNSNCSFCECAIETIFHLFWQCPVTQIFIKEVLSHLRIRYDMVIHINSVNWFMLMDLSNIEVIIATLGKACIHKARLKLTKPTVELMIQTLKLEASKEYNIAKTHNRIEEFEHKWGDLSKILNRNSFTH